MLLENGRFLAAAYIVASCIYLGYTVSLFVRAARERRAR
jgi:hypothetical protein